MYLNFITMDTFFPFQSKRLHIQVIKNSFVISSSQNKKQKNIFTHFFFKDLNDSLFNLTFTKRTLNLTLQIEVTTF